MKITLKYVIEDKRVKNNVEQHFKHVLQFFKNTYNKMFDITNYSVEKI